MGGNIIILLKKLSWHCNFATFLDRALCDRFVECWMSESNQNYWTNQPLLSIWHAKLLWSWRWHVKVHMSFDKPCWHSQKAVPKHKHNKTGKRTSRQSYGKNADMCYRCNGQLKVNKCQFKDSLCCNCQKKGHIASACRQPSYHAIIYHGVYASWTSHEKKVQN